jgi:hypothetical protein
MMIYRRKLLFGRISISEESTFPGGGFFPTHGTISTTAYYQSIVQPAAMTGKEKRTEPSHFRKPLSRN